CLGEVDFTVEEPAVLEASVETGEILCFEGTTAVELTVGGGTAPYVLSDNNSDFALDIDVAGTIELSGLSAGEFSWTVTDANGCTVLVEFELTQPEQLEAEVTYEPIACFEGTTDVTVTATGGVGPYLLYNESIAEENLVTEFDGSFTVPGLGAGEYIWFVVDANGCDTPVEFELVQPEELTASFILDPENILCHNGVTTAIVFAEGGTEPYFLYDGDVLVAEFFGSYTVMDVAPGSYSWTVTDSKNCGPVAIEFELENPDPIIADVESTLDILCFNDNTGEIHVVAMGGTGALTYSLNGGEPQDNGSFYNLFAGDYVVTVTDENGCYITIDVELLQPEELTLDIFEIVHATGGQHNGQIWANIFGGVGPYNVCLHTECTLDDDGEDQPVLKSQGMMYWGLQPGWYMITVVDQNGCVVMECVEIINEEEDKIDDEALTDNNFVVAENTYVSAYPNPFRNNATIEFQVVQTQHVSLEVYNLIGERVAVLFNGVANAYETYKKNFDAGALPNGVYFYRLTLGDQVLFDRMILSR
ncbi:MAG: T9SS type A sorting domain-containing protein, partial [Bacteroidales bacterium]